MKFFNRQSNKKLEQLLKQSQQNFQFDEEKVKNRLMYSLNDAPIKAPIKTVSFNLRIIKYSSMVAGLAIFISATFVFASNAKPGDKLFPVNKLGEKVILSLPLTVEQKAAIQTRMVSNRLEALTEVKTESSELETVKESDETLKRAVDAVSANKQRLLKSGNTQAAARLDNTLVKLEDLAQQHEQKVETLEQTSQNPETRKLIKAHLLEIRNSHERVRMEIKSQKSDDDSKSSDELD
jgi:hypothetical protein